MKIKKTLTTICSLILFACLSNGASVAQKKATGKAAAQQPPAKSRAAKSDEALKAEFEALLKLPVAERVERLRAFIEANPQSSLRTRATEQLVSAHAVLGDERLQMNDAAGGVEFFKKAVALAPADMSDKLYYEIVSQLPANLFLRGEAAAALELARSIEPKAATDARRLLTLAAFYVSVEQADEAARVARAAITLQPNLAPAHQALGAAHRLALRLDEAAAEYARSVELDPRSMPARRSLADLRRATGKAEEALVLYRELFAADAKDVSARTGLVLALFDAGKREEAERELEAALTDEPRNLPLLVGAAYWYAGHGETPRALALAEQAVKIEPRYTWAHVALARALIANKLPLEAERSLRFARQYGRFPTLDYELANALVAAGLYNEAFEELTRTFTLKDSQLQTQLAGRTPARSDSFIELLAPERRASIFQANAADTEANARMIKALLTLNLALNAMGEGSAAAGGGDASALAAVSDFTSGTDEMRAFRQLYAASGLLRRGIAPNSVLELMDAARLAVEAAVNAPAATVATTADELRDARASAIAQGSVPSIPSLPRNAISNILRGRIEELTGMALLAQGKTAELVVALKRAVSVLPEKSLYWRTAQWRLGTALASSSGQERDALAAYLKSYNPATPDPARRAVIEALYTKVNGGSRAGLDTLIGAAPERVVTFEATNAGSPTATPAPAETPASAAVVTAMPEPSPMSTPDAPVVIPATPTPEPAPSATPTPDAPVNTTPAPESPVATPTPQATPEATPAAEPSPPPTPVPANANAETNAAVTTAAAAPAEAKRVRDSRNTCTFVLSAGAVELTNSGGSASVIASLEGNDNLMGISAATINWSDIIVLREPQGSADTSSLKFIITSISKNTGNFQVNFKSPCGAQELTVRVK